MEKPKVSRRAVLSDFIQDTNVHNSDSHINKSKTKKYRIQGEYGFY